VSPLPEGRGGILVSAVGYVTTYKLTATRNRIPIAIPIPISGMAYSAFYYANHLIDCRVRCTDRGDFNQTASQ